MANPTVVLNATLSDEAINQLVTLFGLASQIATLNVKLDTLSEAFANLSATIKSQVQQLVVFQQEMEQMAQIQQSDIDTITNTLTGIKGSIDTIDSTEQTIQQEVAALQAANPTLDLTALTAAANTLGTSRDTLQGHVDSLQASLAPVIAPTPTPDPTV